MPKLTLHDMPRVAQAQMRAALRRAMATSSGNGLLPARTTSPGWPKPADQRTTALRQGRPDSETVRHANVMLLAEGVDRGGFLLAGLQGSTRTYCIDASGGSRHRRKARWPDRYRESRLVLHGVVLDILTMG
jgi:hypothetical protein